MKSSFLKSIGNAATNALFGIPLFHSGGRVTQANIPGTDETLALLRVGETVRTPQQEASLKSGQSVIASGGVSQYSDVSRLAEHASAGVAGAIIGKALYTKNIKLQEAIKLI